MLGLNSNETVYLAFEGMLLRNCALVSQGVKRGSKVLYYVPSPKKVNLKFLSLLIKERSAHNRELISDLAKIGEKKKISLPLWVHRSWYVQETPRLSILLKLSRKNDFHFVFVWC